MKKLYIIVLSLCFILMFGINALAYDVNYKIPFIISNVYDDDEQKFLACQYFVDFTDDGTGGGYTVRLGSECPVLMNQDVNQYHLKASVTGKDVVYWYVHTDNKWHATSWATSPADIDLNKVNPYGHTLLGADHDVYNYLQTEVVIAGGEPVMPISYDEYLTFSLPREGSSTTSKTIVYWINYKIEASSYEDIGIHIYDIDGVTSLDNVAEVESYELEGNTGEQNGIYYTGFLRVRVTYSQNFVGQVGIVCSVNNTETARYLVNGCSLNITAFTDANQDGIDDNTGEEPYEYPDNPGYTSADDVSSGAPDRADYEAGVWGDISCTMDTIKYYITLPFKFIAETFQFIIDWVESSLTWITSVSNLFKVLFGYLPDEVIGGITILFMVTIVFTIIRVVRGS